MTFHINSPTSGAGATFGTASLAGIRGEAALGFFRLSMNVDFVLEPSGASTVQADTPLITELVADARVAGKVLGRFIPMSPGYLPIRPYPARSERPRCR